MYRVGWLCCKHMFFDVCICPVEIDIWQSILMMSSHSCDDQCMWYVIVSNMYTYIYFYDPYCILKDSTHKMECQPPKKDERQLGSICDLQYKTWGIIFWWLGFVSRKGIKFEQCSFPPHPPSPVFKKQRYTDDTFDDTFVYAHPPGILDNNVYCTSPIYADVFLLEKINFSPASLDCWRNDP